MRTRLIFTNRRQRKTNRHGQPSFHWTHKKQLYSYIHFIHLFVFVFLFCLQYYIIIASQPQRKPELHCLSCIWICVQGPWTNWFYLEQDCFLGSFRLYLRLCSYALSFSRQFVLLSVSYTKAGIFNEMRKLSYGSQLVYRIS